jgi:hypothetical protein
LISHLSEQKIAKLGQNVITSDGRIHRINPTLVQINGILFWINRRTKMIIRVVQIRRVEDFAFVSNQVNKLLFLLICFTRLHVVERLNGETFELTYESYEQSLLQQDLQILEFTHLFIVTFFDFLIYSYSRIRFRQVVNEFVVNEIINDPFGHFGWK